MSEPTIEIMNTPQVSIYEEFGVSNAVISGDLSEHEESMLQSPVAVRDGDDEITYEEDDEDDVEDDESIGEVESDVDTGEDDLESVEESSDPESAEGSDEEPAGGDSDSLSEAARELSDNIESTNALLEEAIDKGLDPAIEAKIAEEYATGEGLSDATYEALADAGLSKHFVDAFIKSQEIIAEQFNQAVFSYVGGQASYTKLTSFMQANMPDAVTAFNAAVDRHDSATMKFILDQAKQSQVKKFGSRPSKAAPAAAKQSKPVNAPQFEPFADRSEMIKAMSDKRYERDAVYRREVEQRVYASNI